MSTKNAVKYRRQHKRLKDLKDEATRHGFKYRIHVPRSRTHPSDPVFYAIWAIEQPLGSDQPNNSDQDPAPTEDKNCVWVADPVRIDVAAAASSNSPRSHCVPTDVIGRISSYSETMAGNFGRNTPNHHTSPTEEDGDIFSCSNPLTTKGCDRNASQSIIPYTGSGWQVHEGASYTPHDEFQGTTYDFRRGIMSQYPIASGGIPYSPPASHGLYCDCATPTMMIPPDGPFVYSGSSQMHDPVQGAASGGFPLPVPGSLHQSATTQHGGSTWEINGIDSRYWNQYSMPYMPFPASPYRFGAEEQNYFRMPIGDIYPTALLGTAPLPASSESFPWEAPVVSIPTANPY